MLLCAVDPLTYQAGMGDPADVSMLRRISALSRLWSVFWCVVWATSLLPTYNARAGWLSREITVFGLQSSCVLLNVCARKYPSVCLTVSGLSPHSLSSACHWFFPPAVGSFPCADLPSSAHWGPSVGGRPFVGSLLSRGGKSFPLAFPQSIRKAPSLWALKEATPPHGSLSRAGLHRGTQPAVPGLEGVGLDLPQSLRLSAARLSESVPSSPSSDP